MKLTVTCKSCREPTKIPHNESSRPYLADKIGEEFNHRCTNCGTMKNYHVNQVVANKSNVIRFGGTVLGLIILVGVTLGFFVTGYITTLGLILGGGIIGASNISGMTSNEKAFNSYYI